MFRTVSFTTGLIVHVAVLPLWVLIFPASLQRSVLLSQRANVGKRYRNHSRRENINVGDTSFNSLFAKSSIEWHLLESQLHFNYNWENMESTVCSYGVCVKRKHLRTSPHCYCGVFTGKTFTQCFGTGCIYAKIHLAKIHFFMRKEPSRSSSSAKKRGFTISKYSLWAVLWQACCRIKKQTKNVYTVHGFTYRSLSCNYCTKLEKIAIIIPLPTVFKYSK